MITRLRSAVRRAHMAVLRYRIRQFRHAATTARRYCRDVYVMRSPSNAERLLALDAWKDAGFYESQAEALRTKLDILETA